MSSIRTLLLGILNDQKPRHGYEVRQVLESWNADKWANISYGSIYFALKTMAEEGLLEIVNNRDKDDQSDKTIYKITKAGNAAFMASLLKQWLELKPAIDPFQVALTFMNYLSKDELLNALQHRTDSWRFVIKSSDRVLPLAMKNIDLPKHIDENHKLIIAHYQTELNFIEALIEKVKKDELP